jgi:hypothetical protein
MIKFEKAPNLNGLPVVNKHTAGIDVGSMLMSVAFTNSKEEELLFETSGYTNDLQELVSVLKNEGVTDVAMESTGPYWYNLYDLLERAEMEVTLINPGHYKTRAIQKTDIKDCQWIHQYHACGILRESHIATEDFRDLRDYIHERNKVQTQKSNTLNSIQYILTKMNVKLQHIISDIEGVGGMLLLNAIASGESNPKKLVAMINLSQYKSSEQDFLEALNGFYLPKFVNLLKMKLEEYEFYKSQMLRYETYIEEILIRMTPAKVSETPAEVSEQKKSKPQKKKYVRKNQYNMDVKGYLQKILGVDLTKVEGLDEKVLMDIISVTGKDMSKWPTAQHFVSYLRLAPRPRISGGKKLGHENNSTANPATQGFYRGGHSLANSTGYFGNLYRSICIKKGKNTANKVIARKLAVLFYTLVKNQTPYDTTFRTEREKEMKEKKLAKIKKEADKLGYSLEKKSA